MLSWTQEKSAILFGRSSITEFSAALLLFSALIFEYFSYTTDTFSATPDGTVRYTFSKHNLAEAVLDFPCIHS